MHFHSALLLIIQYPSLKILHKYIVLTSISSAFKTMLIMFLEDFQFR